MTNRNAYHGNAVVSLSPRVLAINNPFMYDFLFIIDCDMMKMVKRSHLFHI